jgi:uncharacterized membrane protein
MEVMMDKLILVLTIAAALGSGLIAGLFFVFSNTIMKALGRLPASEGIAAMNSINLVILNPVFLGVFLGTGAICALLTVSSLLRWQNPGTGYVVAGAAIYLIGSLLLTMVFNVPMNNALAASPTDTDLWANYLSNWTFWNHIRAAASFASAALLSIALVHMGK